MEIKIGETIFFNELEKGKKMDGDNKYKMFRNYMVNELGIGREDIERWTKEAIAENIKRLVGQMNIEGMVRQLINQNCNVYAIRQNVADALAKEIASKLVIKTKE